jgi:predicted nucleic acid-binding Zn ribbon protein
MIYYYPQQSFVGRKNGHTCLSCGSILNLNRQYCSSACRQQLREYLNRRTGLLVALNTRYATFYFTSFVIVTDILPYGTNQIFSFINDRTPGNKPVVDFCDMFQDLGNVWWSEQKRTRKRYMATLQVLDMAKKVNSEPKRIVPKWVTVPAVRKKDLSILCLNKTEFFSDGLEGKIKNAYRRQAKKHHPDVGGDASKFRHLQNAYEKMICWSKNPTFLRIKGFPDKWLYEGATNRWIQPAPIEL